MENKTIERKLSKPVRTDLVGIADFLSEHIHRMNEKAIDCLKRDDYVGERYASGSSIAYGRALEKVLTTFPEIDRGRYAHQL